MSCRPLSYLLAAGLVAQLLLAGPAAAALTAKDQGNGEILLEWSAVPGAVGYRVERQALGLSTVSLEAGDSLSVMDIAGLASSYQYRLLARGADGKELRAATYNYARAPTDVVARVSAAAGRQPIARSALGTNLLPIIPATTQAPFVDLMKIASPWVSGDVANWSNNLPVDVDENGWVRSLSAGQIARTTMYLEGAPGGEYTVRYKGEGTLLFDQGASIIAGSERPGEMRILVSPELKGMAMHISATNTSNYLRDIEVLMPGGICEGDPFTRVLSADNCKTRFLSFAAYGRAIIFNPRFAARTRGYTVVRFMDWMHTNGSTVKTWAQRTPFSYRTWTGDTGAPIELMIALANRVGAHPWFNIPHQSDDTYAQNFATMVKERLDPALGVYLEHSNELWNGLFPQGPYAIAQAALQVPPIDSNQWHALRTRTAGQTFKQILGDRRVMAVFAAQAGNTWTATHGLDYLKTRYGAGSMGIDAIAIAPYFIVTPDLTDVAKYTSMSLTTFIDYVRSTVLPMSAGMTATYRGIANTYGVRLVSYEGGQHMVGVRGAENDAALNDLFSAFNRDPRIKQLYLDYLADWKSNGGELFVHYNDVAPYGKWGFWGSLERINQLRADVPKFDALQTFMEQNTVWWTQ